MKKITSPFITIKDSWNIFTDKKNFTSLLKIYSPTAVLTLLSLLFVYVQFLSNYFQTNSGNIVMMIFNILFVLTIIFTNLSGIIALSRITEGKTVNIKSVFSEALHKYFIFIVFNVAIYLSYGLGIMLLIVPFVLVAVWFNFAKFILVNEGKGIKNAFTESKKLVKGRFWPVLIRLFVFQLFLILSEMIISVLPYGLGMVIFRLFGALFLLPQVLLFKELVATKPLQEVKV